MVVGALGGLLLIGGLIWAFSGLPAFGHYDHRYGRLVARESVPERAATNSVNVTAFDYRGIDTLGEEFIVFVSVVAVVVLLRRLRDERQLEEQAGNGSAGGPEAGDAYAEGEGAASRAPASPLQRWFGLALGPTLMLLAAYVITHGQLTPGGGFQGGVVLMGALGVVFVSGEYTLLRRMRSSTGIEMLESAGAAGFAALGFGGLIASGVFFQNFIAKGTSGLLTGGFIPIANLAVGIEVAAGLLMVLTELIDQRARA